MIEMGICSHSSIFGGLHVEGTQQRPARRLSEAETALAIKHSGELTALQIKHNNEKVDLFERQQAELAALQAKTPKAVPTHPGRDD